MGSFFKFLVAFLAMAVLSSQAEKITLVVGYCPTAFTSEGAIVSVESTTGDWKIDKTFRWPQEAVFGCLVQYDPTVKVHGDMVYFDFTGEADMVSVNLKTAKVEHVKPSDSFFTGFTNMAFVAPSSLIGLTPTVTEDGFCEDGCFGFGELSVRSGKYARKSVLPFKAMLDDSHYYDEKNHVFYAQGSYDLRPPSEACAPVASDECLVAVDGRTGELISAVGPNDFTVYHYAQSADADGNVLAWVEGFDSTCQHPYNNFAFATVNLKKATAELIACIPTNTTVHMDEWIAAFSPDDSILATGSGDAETGVPQLLVFDTKTGATLLDSPLKGLKEKLGSFQGMLTVWAVAILS